MKKQDAIEQERKNLIERVTKLNEEQTDRLLSMLMEAGLLDQSNGSTGKGGK